MAPPKSKPKAKTKAAPKKTPEIATPENNTPESSSKKRKVDWAAIDDSTFDGFTLVSVKTTKTSRKSAPTPKKQKSAKSEDGETESYNKDAPLDADITQKNPFPNSELSETHYQVEPSAEWESTQRYRKFTSESIISTLIRSPANTFTVSHAEFSGQSEFSGSSSQCTTSALSTTLNASIMSMWLLTMSSVSPW